MAIAHKQAVIWQTTTHQGHEHQAMPVGQLGPVRSHAWLFEYNWEACWQDAEAGSPRRGPLVVLFWSMPVVPGRALVAHRRQRAHRLRDCGEAQSTEVGAISAQI